MSASVELIMRFIFKQSNGLEGVQYPYDVRIQSTRTSKPTMVKTLKPCDPLRRRTVSILMERFLRSSSFGS